jgi:hypothetical protein
MARLILGFISLCFALLMCQASHCQSAPDSNARITIEGQDQPLEDVLADVAKQGGFKVVCSSKITPEVRGRTRSLGLRNCPFSQAIQMISDCWDCPVSVEDGCIRVFMSEGEAAAREAVQEVLMVSPEEIEACVADLGNDKIEIYDAATDKLTRCGVTVVPRLVAEYSTGNDPGVRRRIVTILAAIGEASFEVLKAEAAKAAMGMELAAGGDYFVRTEYVAACKALCSFGEMEGLSGLIDELARKYDGAPASAELDWTFEYMCDILRKYSGVAPEKPNDASATVAQYRGWWEANKDKLKWDPAKKQFVV